MIGLGPIELIIILVLCFVLVALPIGVALAIGLTRRASRPEAEGRVPCPYCAELILPAAKVCRFCGRELPQSEMTDRSK